jgi:hypothetical protein
MLEGLGDDLGYHTTHTTPLPLTTTILVAIALQTTKIQLSLLLLATSHIGIPPRDLIRER